MNDDKDVRAVFGVVTHADGTQTCGLHVRQAQGPLAYVLLTEATVDEERWAWACQEAARILRESSA